MEESVIVGVICKWAGVGAHRETDTEMEAENRETDTDKRQKTERQTQTDKRQKTER